MFVHVGIKRRERKPSEFNRIAVLIFFDDDIGAGFLIFQLNFIPHQLDAFPARRVGGIRWNHQQAHARAFFSADHLDNLVQSHLADVDIIRRALCHGGNPIAYFKSSIYLRRPAGHQALNFCITVFRAEHRADAHEREAHVDAEIFHVRLAQVFRVRVICLGERVQIKFHLLVLILLVDVAVETIIAASNQLRSRLNRVFAQMLLQQLVCDTTPPELVGFGLIFWPGRFLAAQLDRCITLEIDRLLQQVFYLGDPLVNALRVQRVNVVGRLERAKKNVFCHRAAVLGVQLIDIFLGKKKMTEIEHLQIRLQEFS